MSTHRIIYSTIIGLVALTSSCTSRPATQLAAADATHDVAYPRNTLPCDDKGRASAQAWLDAWVSWQGHYDPLEVGERTALALPHLHGAKLEQGNPPLLSWHITENATILDGRKITEGAIDKAATIELSDALIRGAKQRLEEHRALEFPTDNLWMGLAIDRASTLDTTSKVLEVLTQDSLAQGARVFILFQAPPLPDNVEPIPDELHSLGAHEPPGSRREMLAPLEDKARYLNGCKTIGGSASNTSQFFLGGDYVGGWMGCGCAADIESLTAMLLPSPTIALRKLEVIARSEDAPSPTTQKWGALIDGLKPGKCAQLTSTHALCAPKT